MPYRRQILSVRAKKSCNTPVDVPAVWEPKSSCVVVVWAVPATALVARAPAANAGMQPLSLATKAWVVVNAPKFTPVDCVAEAVKLVLIFF